MKSIKIKIWALSILWILLFFFLSALLSKVETPGEFFDLFLTKRFAVSVLSGVLMGWVFTKVASRQEA
jgi:hypothetical protein